MGLFNKRGSQNRSLVPFQAGLDLQCIRMLDALLHNAAVTAVELFHSLAEVQLVNFCKCCLGEYHFVCSAVTRPHQGWTCVGEAVQNHKGQGA